LKLADYLRTILKTEINRFSASHCQKKSVMPNFHHRLLSYVVMIYLLLAFGWWALLLHNKNEEAFEAKKALLEYRQATGGSQTADLQVLEKKYRRQHQMIFGEATMFVVTLLTGIWFIHRSYQREVLASRRQRNFLLSITHELKSPLSSIRLVLETFLKRELSKSQADKLATSALKENERLHELVENLLLSAKLETEYRPHFTEINLVSLAEDLLSKLSDKHPGAKVSLSAPQNFPLLRCDKNGITSLLLNLLENAVKYSPGDPVIEVRLSAARKVVTLEVADQGAGIPERERQRIFEKFYRIGSEETRQTKGTGLGLFIVNQIVKSHRGHIRVFDNQPKGTVFSVELPL
jgi:signal transduction histidine kinase